MKEKILLVEDEEKLARFVEMELSFEGYEVHKAADGRTGLAMLESEQYDLLLLDIMLPGINGMEVLRRVRRTSAVPVIMLTARDSVMDKVTGLDSGADDYITKPFAIEELLARIRTALRRNTGGSGGENSLRLGDLALDIAAHEVTVGDTVVELTKKEFDLLHYLLQNKGIVVTRDALLRHVWGYEYDGENSVVGVYIRFLRAKIDEAFGVKYIHTVRGVGYVLKEAD